MKLEISYDMRAPDFGAPAREIYAAALEQASWADELGFDTIGLGEHHCSSDGYNPSPLVLAAAMGARTKRIGGDHGLHRRPPHRRRRQVQRHLR